MVSPVGVAGDRSKERRPSISISLEQSRSKITKMATSGVRNPELRKDAVSNRWVIFSPARAKRPSDFKSKNPTNSDQNHQKCPFCIGQEHQCAPEIFRFPSHGSDWRIRVIENLYPALSRNLHHPSASTFDSGHAIGNCVLDGFGFHDVVIETPTHSVQLSDLSPEEIAQVFLAYKKRTEHLASNDSIKYVQVYFSTLFTFL